MGLLVIPGDVAFYFVCCFALIWGLEQRAKNTSHGRGVQSPCSQFNGLFDIRWGGASFGFIGEKTECVEAISFNNLSTLLLLTFSLVELPIKISFEIILAIN